MVEKSLVELCRKYAARKPGKNRFIGAEYYVDTVYPKYFNEIKGEVKTLLEIGVEKGGSLRMWREFFPNAQIYGVDIDPSCYFEEPRIKVLIGDQCDGVFLNKVTRSMIDPLDIVIDDGLHRSDATVRAFNSLFHKLRKGGLYIIEDSVAIRIQDRRYNRRSGQKLKESIWNTCGGLAKHCSSLGQKRVEFVHYWPGMVVIKK